MRSVERMTPQRKIKIRLLEVNNELLRLTNLAEENYNSEISNKFGELYTKSKQLLKCLEGKK
jgi:hypothetical protein